jgi:hypothetical protein
VLNRWMDSEAARNAAPCAVAECKSATRTRTSILTLFGYRELVRQADIALFHATKDRSWSRN